MGANRKLQTEIDKTMKKVAEGIEQFGLIWDKVHETEGNQKEKFEGDLKKEIKKLQRCRDLIKTWTTGNDVKDKTVLLKARKDIEREMERFKVCEKEMKTKAFSKEGLGQAAKLDPQAVARKEMEEWLNASCARMEDEIESWEADLDNLQGVKKKSKAQLQQLHRLEESISRHRRHVDRLQQMLRLLDNEAVLAQDLESTKDMVEDYLERGREDFDEFSAPDDAYTDILAQLEALDVSIPAPAVVHIGKAKDAAKDKDKERERQVEKERQAALAAKQQLAAAGAINVQLDADGLLSPEKPLARKAAEAVAARGRGAGLPPLAPPAKMETAQSDAASIGNISTPSTPGHAPQHPLSHAAAAPVALQGLEEQRTAAPVGPQATMLRPGGNATMAEAFPQLGRGGPSTDAKRAGEGAPPRPGMQNGTMGPAAGKPNTAYPAGVTYASQTSNAQPVKDDRRAHYTPSTQGSVAGDEDGAEGGLGAAPVPSIKQALAIREGGMIPESPHPIHTTATAPTLQACWTRSIPQPYDHVWNATPPRQANLGKVGFPPSYPTTRLPGLDTPELISKQDPEALFYAFYYQPGTYQQILAAKELKRQSWRFHKHHNAWFQRHEEPKMATAEYEQGTYVYFDYNILHDDDQNGWCYRLKTDFTFKYDALENEIQSNT